MNRTISVDPLPVMIVFAAIMLWVEHQQRSSMRNDLAAIRREIVNGRALQEQAGESEDSEA